MVPNPVRRWIGRIIAGMLCVFLLGIGTLLWFLFGLDRPSERFLQQNFIRHRPEIDRLVQMKAEDKQVPDVYAYAESNTGFPGDGIPRMSEKRFNEYVPLFKSTGLETVMSRGPDDVYLGAWANGFIHGTHVGYLHCGPGGNGSQNSFATWPCTERKEAGSGEDDTVHNGFYYAYRYKRIAQDWYVLEVRY